MAVLRRQVFRYTRHATDAELEAYLAKVFFESPWATPEQPCYVYESRPGEIVGFIGVIPREARVGQRILRAAVASQLMVDPEHRGVAGIRLLQQLFSGPQDLLFTDVVNPSVLRLWQGLGGSVVPAYGLYWKYPLTASPRAAMGRVLHRMVPEVVRKSSWHSVPSTGPAGRGAVPESVQTPLTPDLLAERIPELVGRQILYIRSHQRAAEWLFQQLSEKWGSQSVHARAVHTADGTLAGWFVLVRGPDRIAQVLQFVARDELQDLVWRALTSSADRAGAIAVRGRYDPLLTDTLALNRCTLSVQGPGLLVHARDPATARQVLGGQALLSGLDGEWWLDF